MEKRITGSSTRVLNVLCAGMVVICAHLAWAQPVAGFPTRPLHIIASNTPGGGTDLVMRPVAIKLGEALGQPVVYENRAGGDGLIAGSMVARLPADGKLLDTLGAFAVGNSPEEFTRHLAGENARWAKFVRDNNIKPQ